MNNKNILYVLLLFLLYLNIFTPLSEENRELKQKLVTIKQSIKKDRLYIENEGKINHEVNQSALQSVMYKKKYFYQQEDAQIFNLIQKEIKKLITQTKTKEDNIKWGEKYTNENLIVFPISVRVTGGIRSLGRFFKKISANQKIYIKDFSIKRARQYYVMTLSLYGIKRN